MWVPSEEAVTLYPNLIRFLTKIPIPILGRRNVSIMWVLTFTINKSPTHAPLHLPPSTFYLSNETTIQKDPLPRLKMLCKNTE